MLELMNAEALRLGAERRRELALETMRDIRSARSTSMAVVGIVPDGSALVDEPRANEPKMDHKLEPTLSAAGDCL